MSNYCDLAVPGVQSLIPYQPGKAIDELQREFGLQNIIKLASNENPLGPGEMAISAIKNKLNDFARYPDGNGFELKRKLAAIHSIQPDQITLGNGSNDILEFVARTFVSAGDEVIFSQHAFAVYPLVTQAIGGTICEVPAKDWGHDLQAMLTRISDKTRLIFIANPNNPTGTWLPKEKLVEFLQLVPRNIIVVLDEAYFEYAHAPEMGFPEYPDGIELLSQFENLIVTRTFSKAYGLAGLRVGYGISNTEIADLLNRVRQPFNVNSLALAAASAALDDQDHIRQSVLLNKQGMLELMSVFSSLSLASIPSAGNFICFDLGYEAAPIYTELLKQGVIVRPVANYSMPNHLRVTIGTSAENEIFITALKRVLK
ncbi:Biosynthetic Aromatic amino acid aminotransferase beta [hydrothermal vent metagenome]|uniref:Biosynthetic Aromatic amino acid aminotransferase beta n=1 Tax=hydrothermal vent metagenome TaxID=652676 RepID=A0A3B0ZBU0_9ZZZZ